jgi:radical SAM protein with 4Fe4S-binding SPASM domain
MYQMIIEKTFYFPLKMAQYLIGSFAVSDKRILSRLQNFFPTYTSMWYEVRNQFNRLIGNPAIYKLQTVHIEPTNACNLKCLHCTPQNLKGIKRGLMDFSLFKNIVDQLTDLKVVILSWNGEPFLHPRLFDMCKYLKDNNIYVIIYTNGTFLTENNIKQVLSSGVPEIDVSADGLEKIYEKNRGFDYNIFKNNLLNLLELRKCLGSPIRVLLTVTNAPNTESYKRKIIDEWGNKVDYIHFAHLMGEKSRPRKKLCKTLFRHAAISWDGKICPCVVDMQQTMLFGEITKDLNIMDIINSPKAKQYRLNHRKRKFEDICKYCDDFYG